MIYTRWFHKKISVSWKVDGQYKIGKLIQVIDFSDITFSLNYRIIDSLGIFLSGKISLNRANKKFNGKFIPMAYQTRLGTYEAIIYQVKSSTHWEFSFSAPAVARKVRPEDLSQFAIIIEYSKKI